MTARLYKLAYQMKLHQFGDWSLERWAATLAWLAAAVIVLQWLIRGRPALPLWHWFVVAVVVLFALGWPVYRRIAERHGFLVFQGTAAAVLPPPIKMDPEDKVPVRATGTFEVAEKRHFFTELEAYWRTYGSREHAVLAKAEASRFLLVGKTPADVRGMWYLFFKPQDIRGIEPGQVAYGVQSGPALRVAYMMTPYEEGKKRQKKPYKAVTVLRFSNDTDREKVWADLRYDHAEAESAPRLPGRTNGKLRL
jgi:hypothetical protein